MTSIAELGIRVDSSEAAGAAIDLEKLAKAGDRAEQSAVGLMSEMQALEKSLSSGAKTTGELARQREALAKLTKTGAYGEAEYLKISAQLDKQQQALAKSTADEQKALASLLGSIDPARAALSKLDKQVEDLGKHLDAGRISQEQYNAAIKKLDGKYAEIEKTSSAFSGLGLNTKGARENVLQLGNALAEGNFRVAAHNLLEIGNSAGFSALRLGAIVAPIAAAAGAVAGLTYSFYQGSKEGDAYNASLVLTGNYAGTTASQLSAMARQVSATIGTTGAAAEVLATLAGNGKVAGDSFELIATAAVAMNEATGKAVSDTVSEFVKLAEDPVKASAALNQQYHYLTASVYSQIVALEKQGDHAGAVKLATEQYADAINERTPRILENLSFWEKGYNAVAKAADALKNVGRDDIDSDIDRVRKNLAMAQSGDIGLFQNKSTMVEFYTDQLNLLEDRKAAEADIAKWESEQAKAQSDAVSAMTKIDTLTKSSLTNDQKRAAQVKEYKQLLDDIRKVNPNDARLDQALVDRNIANINAKYKDPKTPTSPVNLGSFNDSKNALSAIQAEYKNYQKELDAAQKAGIVSQESYAAQRKAIIEQQSVEVVSAYSAEIAALEAAKGKSTTTASQRIQLDQKIADARANMVKAQKDADSELAVIATNEEGRLRKQALAVQTYTDALDQQVKALRLQGQRSAENLGMGDRQRGLQDQQNGIADRINQQRLDLANQYGDGSRGMSLDEYNQKLKVLNNTQRDLQETAVANYNDMSKAQGSWSAGASSAFQNYLESARDVAGQTKSLFTNAFSSMEDAVVNFAMTGKFSFADFAKSVLADIARIATRQAMAGIAGSIIGSAAGAYFSPGGTTVSTSGFSEGGFVPNAKGGVYDSPSLSSFSNQVHDTPQFFAFAKGAGVFGEAGPEAIMPLTRAPDGNLGVRAVGGSSGGGTMIQISAPVTVSTGDRSSEGMELDQQALQKNLQIQMKMAAEKAVADSWRPGGTSYMKANGRA